MPPTNQAPAGWRQASVQKCLTIERQDGDVWIDLDEHVNMIFDTNHTNSRAAGIPGDAADSWEQPCIPFVL